MKKHTQTIWLSLFCLVALGLGACTQVSEEYPDTPDENNQNITKNELKSDKARVTEPEASDSEVKELTSGQQDFSFTLYQELREKDEGNIFYSPYSISQAMTMLYAGAKGDTAQQMHDVLGYGDLTQTSLHPAYNKLGLELASRGQNAEGKDGEPFKLKVANAVWLQRNMSVEMSYLDILAQQYGAGMRLMDFQEKPEDARLEINDWVAEQTEQKIKDLLPQGSVNGGTRMVLTNAIYFNAAWASKFEKDATADADFTLSSGQTVNASMMKQEGNYKTGVATNGTRVIELPYDGGELSMVILMPEQGKLAQVEEKLSSNSFKTYNEALTSQYIILGLPKFEFKSQFPLVDAFQTLGMNDVFDSGKADLSGINGQRDLYVTGVFHKAFVGVNETGTEAAAATGVVVGTTSVPTVQDTVIMNRPFIFVIRDNKTNAPLFVGRVMDPTK